MPLDPAAPAHCSSDVRHDMRRTLMRIGKLVLAVLTTSAAVPSPDLTPVASEGQDGTSPASLLPGQFIQRTPSSNERTLEEARALAVEHESAVDQHRRRSIRDRMWITVRFDDDIACRHGYHSTVLESEAGLAFRDQAEAHQALGCRRKDLPDLTEVRHRESPGRRALHVEEKGARHPKIVLTSEGDRVVYTAREGIDGRKELFVSMVDPSRAASTPPEK